MSMFIGLTDFDWYSNLKEKKLDEVNFWKPGGNTSFQAIQPNDLFLFKLKKPYYHIVGGGFFVSFSFLPISLAWSAFGVKNGTRSYIELEEKIKKYREKNHMQLNNPSIGCIILTEPFFQ